MGIHNYFILTSSGIGAFALVCGNYHSKLRAIEREYELVDAFVKTSARRLNGLFSNYCFSIPSSNSQESSVSLQDMPTHSSFNSLPGPLPSCHYFLSICLRDGIDDWKGWGRAIRHLRSIRRFCLVFILIAVLAWGLELGLADFPQQGTLKVYEIIKLIVGILLLLSVVILSICFWRCIRLTNKRNLSLLSNHECLSV
jgi:hypothetical protein